MLGEIAAVVAADKMIRARIFLGGGIALALDRAQMQNDAGVAAFGFFEQIFDGGAVVAVCGTEVFQPDVLKVDAAVKCIFDIALAGAEKPQRLLW